MYQACPELRTLRLACCGSLQPEALAPLLRPPEGADAHGSKMDAEDTALPHLRELDVSYCALPRQAVQDLLCLGSRFEVRSPPTSRKAPQERRPVLGGLGLGLGPSRASGAFACVGDNHPGRAAKRSFVCVFAACSSAAALDTGAFGQRVLRGGRRAVPGPACVHCGTPRARRTRPKRGVGERHGHRLRSVTGAPARADLAVGRSVPGSADVPHRAGAERRRRRATGSGGPRCCPAAALE